MAVDRLIKNTQEYNDINQAYGKDAKYVGYKYGGAKGEASTNKTQAELKETDSDIKKVVEEWYATNLSDEDKYLADGTFCVDRSISSTPGEWMSSEPALSGDKDLRGFGANNTAYGAYGRFKGTTKTNIPQFTCPRGEDIFTVANGGLGKKIGLITADEVVAAGTGPSSDNFYYYLNKGIYPDYWTLSPYRFNVDYASLLTVANDGLLSFSYNNSGGEGVAPVINLSAEYASKLLGTGTIDDPYYLTEEQ